MRKAVLLVAFLFICASSAFAAGEVCTHTLNVGADPRNPNRVPQDGEYPIRLKEPLCVDENAGHRDHVKGFLPVGTIAYVRQGEGDKIIPVWVAKCGNDINHVYASQIRYESLNDRPEVSDEGYYQDDGVPSQARRNGPVCQDQYAANYGQPGQCVYYQQQAQPAQSNGMTREEFLLAIQAMQPRASNWDRFMQGFGVVTQAYSIYQQNRLITTLRNPIRVTPTQPIPCYGRGCGRAVPTNPYCPTCGGGYNPTPPPTTNCPYCTPGHAPRPPCVPGVTCR
jgi:hypothetical protein